MEVSVRVGLPPADPKQDLRCWWFMGAVITGPGHAIRKPRLLAPSQPVYAPVGAIRCEGKVLSLISAIIPLVGEREGRKRETVVPIC